MDLGSVMQELADQVATIGKGLTVHGFPADRVGDPAAIVTYPGSYVFDGGYGRGMDRIPDLAIVVIVGAVDDRGTRDRIAKYANGSGPESIKQVVESGAYTSFDSVRVTRVDFDPVSISGTEYLAATFACDIVGKGTA